MGTEVVTSLLVSLGLTVAIELAFCLICKVRGVHDILLVVLVNILTNPPVVLTHNIIRLNTKFSLLATVVILELLVVIIEGFSYKYCAKNIKHPFALSISANAVSYFSGLLILKLI